MKLLWVSRHTMTEEQLKDLNRIFGDITIIQYDETVTNVENIISDDVDIYALVLPIDKLAQLFVKVKGKARIITPVSKREFSGNYIINPATGSKEKEFVFVHNYWLEYTKIDIESHIL